MNSRLILALAFTLACGGNAQVEDVADDTTSGDELAATPDVFVIAPFTLTDSRGAAIRIDASGQLSMDGQDGPAPIFSESGNVSMDGEVIAIMSTDGVLRTAAGQELAVIGLDGSAAIGELRISFGSDGTLVGGNPSGPGITLSPADSPAKRLAMSVLVMMLTTSSEGAEVAEESPGVSPN